MFLVSIVIGLSMKLVGSNHGCMYFKYDHDTIYQKIQKRFLEAVYRIDDYAILVSNQLTIVLLSADLVQVSVTTFLYLKYCITLH